MLLNGGELDGRRYLKAETVAEMTRTQTGDLKTGFTEGLSFGLHCGVVKTPTGVTAMLSPGTFGHGGAYGTAMWIDPQKKLIVLLMIQRAGLVPNGDGCDLRKDYQTAVVSALGN
jgi:CubicO group peptidase (beta-lactamase class C family)